MEHDGPNIFISFLPLIFLSVLIAISANLLAKDKGRNVMAWTVLGAIPVLNWAFIWYFIGATNLRLERKIDEVIARLAASDGRRSD